MRRLAVVLLLGAEFLSGQDVRANERLAGARLGSGCSATLKTAAFADHLISDQARYQERDNLAQPDRCEGQITEKQGLSAQLDGLERSCDQKPDGVPPRLLLLWTAAVRVDSVLLEIRSFHTVTKYALDSLRPANPASFSWSSKLLTSLGLARKDLRVRVVEDPPPVAGSPLFLPTSWADQSCPPGSGYVASLLVTHLTKRLDAEVWPSDKPLAKKTLLHWNGAVGRGDVIPLSLPASVFGDQGDYVVRLSEPDPDAPGDPEQSRPLFTFRMFHGEQAPPVVNR
jgi:hypothetical protein